MGSIPFMDLYLSLTHKGFQSCSVSETCCVFFPPPQSLEEDFVSWREQFWPAVCEHFGVEPTGEESRYCSHDFIFLLPERFSKTLPV